MSLLFLSSVLVYSAYPYLGVGRGIDPLDRVEDTQYETMNWVGRQFLLFAMCVDVSSHHHVWIRMWVVCYIQSMPLARLMVGYRPNHLLLFYICPRVILLGMG